LGGGKKGYCPGQVTCLLESSAFSIESVYPADPRILDAAAGTSAVSESAPKVYRALAGSSAARFLDELLPLAPGERRLVLFASLILAIIAIAIARDATFAALMISLWAGLMTYALLFSFVTIVLPRYIIPLDVIIWISNALSLIRISDLVVRRNMHTIDGPPRSR
jgi:hypothetical protein